MRPFALLILLTILLTGCKTTGVDDAETAAQSLRDAMAALEDAPGKIDAVSASLTDLSEEGGDMKAEYMAYSTHVDALIKHRKHLQDLSEKVAASREKFVGAWEERLKTIKDPELREKAGARRTEVVEEFAVVRQASDDAKAEFEPWLQTVVDVRTYLENDLNPTGVASVKDKVDQIAEGADSVNEKLATIVSELQRMAEAISAAKPPPPSEDDALEGPDAEEDTDTEE